MSGPEVVDRGGSALTLGTEMKLVILPSIRMISPTYAKHTEIRKVRPGVFITARNSETAAKFFADVPHLSFRKARGISKGDSRKKVPFVDHTYSLVLFSFSSPTEHQKKKAQRLILRTAAIRLRPGVLLFPQLRSRDKTRYFDAKRDLYLYDSNSFAKAITEIGANVRRWGKLRLSNKRGEELIGESFKSTIHKELNSITKKLHAINIQTKNEIRQRTARGQLLDCLRRIKLLKLRHDLLHSIWQFDEEQHIKRVYNLALRTRRKLANPE